MDLPSSAMQALLDAMRGTVAEPITAARGARPLVLIYKIMGEMFANPSLRAEQFVILQYDPFRADLLRETYRGIGHRTHLDPRCWISVDLDADVPADEIRALVGYSWDQVEATPTRKQRQDLAALARDDPAGD